MWALLLMFQTFQTPTLANVSFPHFEGSQLGDFNLNYIACFRTTHTFLAWRSQLVVPSVMNQILNQQKEEEEVAKAVSLESVAESVECRTDEAEDVREVPVKYPSLSMWIDDT
ncbi:hypothetical protein ECG_03613 [Echinococcus granulosus]|nr:hypothetical protein ECG_03613 [Echinococcus granulosus]